MKQIFSILLIVLISCADSKTTKKLDNSSTEILKEQGENEFPILSKHSSSKEIVQIMVTDENGDTFPLSDVMSKQKNYVVSLMASWCGPCIVELNALSQVTERWSKDLNTEIIALSIEKPSDTHKLFAKAKKHNWTMKVFHDRMAYTSKELDVFDIPHTFLVNRDGEIAFRTEGFVSNIVSTYEAEIMKLQI